LWRLLFLVPTRPGRGVTVAKHFVGDPAFRVLVTTPTEGQSPLVLFLPVVIVSSKGSAADQQEGLDAGADATRRRHGLWLPPGAGAPVPRGIDDRSDLDGCANAVNSASTGTASLWGRERRCLAAAVVQRSYDEESRARRCSCTRCSTTHRAAQGSA
jgi:hypothetical protein